MTACNPVPLSQVRLFIFLLSVLISYTIYTVQSNLFITDNKCSYYRGIRLREVGFIWISVSQEPRELSVIERCRKGIIKVSVRRGSTVCAFYFFSYLQIVNLLSL